MKLFKDFLHNPDRKYYLTLAAFFTIYSGLLIFKALYYGEFVPDWDESNHLKMGYLFYNALGDRNLGWVLAIFVHSGQIYPPLYHIFLATSFFIFGATTNGAIFVNIPFIALLMLSLFGIGVYFKNKLAGLIAAVITPTFPVFLSLQERAAIDYASISVFIFSFFIFLKSRGLHSRKYSIIFGVVVLIELLLKWPFVVPSLIFLLILAEKIYKSEDRETYLVNIIIVTCIALPGIVWYFFNFQTIIGILHFFWDRNNFPQEMWKVPNRFSFENLLLYTYSKPMGNVGVGLIPLLSFWAAMLSRFKKSELKYLKIDVVIIYLVLTYLNDKSEYYIAYAYPILAYLASEMFLNINSLYRKTSLTILFCGAIAFNFLLSQHNILNYKDIFMKSGEKIYMIFPNYLTKYPGSLWPTKTLVEEILTPTACSGGVLVFPDSRYLNNSNIKYYLLTLGRNIHTSPAYDFYNPSRSKIFEKKILNMFECIVVKSGDPGIFSNSEVMSAVDKYLLESGEYIVSGVPLPDGSTARIYRRPPSK